MPKNKLEDLRNHLFETLERLKDDEKPIDVERARAVAEVAQTILNSAKLELHFWEVTGQEAESEFLGPVKRPELPPANGNGKK